MEMAAHRIPNSPLPQQNHDGGGSTRKKPHCSYCKNHKKKSSTRQHRCEYKEKCSCILCQLTRKAQLIMCHQQRVWRYRNQILSDQPVIKGQKCDNCRNHSRYVKKSNHDCSFKHCDCRLCKLTFKRREIMKHIQRARRLGVTIESSIQERALEEGDPDGGGSNQDAINGMSALCSDADVEILVSATNSVTVDCMSSSPSVSPVLLPNCTDSPKTPYQNHASSSDLMDSTRLPSKGNDYNQSPLKNVSIDRKKDTASIPCPCDLSNSDLSPQNLISMKSRDHCPSDPRIKPRIFLPVDEAPLSKGQVQDISLSYPRPPPEEDVKPLLFGPPFENQGTIPERRSRLGLCDPQCWTNPPTLKLINDFQPVAPFGGMNPYSSFEWGSYPSSHPMLYPSYIEPPNARQTVLRPRPIIPNRNTNRSPFLFSSLFFRYPNAATLQCLLPQSVREATNTHFRSTDFLQAMYSRFPPTQDPTPRGPPW